MNDVVLVKQVGKPRPFWLLGRVLEVIMGYDNKIRSVKLKLGSGQVSHYSVCHLYPLELAITHSGNKQGNDSAPEDRNDRSAERVNPDFDKKPDCDNVSRRPRRKAADRCRQLLKKNLDDM